MGKRVKVPMSHARARLFELADYVRTAGDDMTVVFEQRGRSEAVALVREARLAYLESRVQTMEQQQKAFTVAGSLASPLDADALDAVLKDVRKAWTPARGSAKAT